jgi:hypothetical protein
MGDKRIRGLGSKYFTWLGDEGRTKKIGVWGLHTLSIFDGILFVCEGVFDAVKVHNAGYPAIAVLCNDPKQLKPQIKALGRTTVGLLDDDQAGEKLRNLVDFNFTAPQPFKDLGEMPQSEVDVMVQNILRSLDVVSFGQKV